MPTPSFSRGRGGNSACATTDIPEGSGHLWAVTPYVSFLPSEFLLFRLGYKYTQQSGGTSSPDNLSEILFQMSFILGAHPAHGF
jgi:hypothetical protein